MSTTKSIFIAALMFLSGGIFALTSKRLSNAGLLRRFSATLESPPTGTPIASTSFILNYEYVEGILEKRAPHRSGHIALLTELHSKGLMKAAGAFSPPTGASFIFTSPKTIVEEFVNSDPYVKAGLVTSYKINEWTVAVGKL
jgi:uncharacterized protein YciI